MLSYCFRFTKPKKHNSNKTAPLTVYFKYHIVVFLYFLFHLYKGLRIMSDLDRAKKEQSVNKQTLNSDQKKVESIEAEEDTKFWQNLVEQIYTNEKCLSPSEFILNVFNKLQIK